jgi:hypothetical protein
VIKKQSKYWGEARGKEDEKEQSRREGRECEGTGGGAEERCGVNE